VRALLTAYHRGGTTTGDTTHLHDRRDHAMGGIPVLEAGRDQQFAAIARLRGVDCGTGGVVQFNRNDHPRQHDRLADEEHGHRPRRRCVL